jgi:hypothetical protein
LKNDVNVPSKVKGAKNFLFKLFFVGILKVNDGKKSRIQSVVHIRRSGSLPKYYGSTTLVEKLFLRLSRSGEKNLSVRDILS